MMSANQESGGDLAAMLGEPEKLRLRVGTIELRPLQLRQFGQILGVLPQALAQFFDTFEGFAQWAEESGLLNDKRELIVSGKSATELLGRLFQHAGALPGAFEHVIEGMAIASGRDKDWVGALDLADAITLGTRLWELNRDFFIRSVWPVVMGWPKSKSPPSGKLSIVPLKPRPNDPSPAGRSSSSG